MIILRCTARAAKAFGFRPILDAAAGTSPLGDWYANLIPTAGGGFFVFVNEQSLLAVVVPRGEQAILQLFVRRVANILAMIGVPGITIERELEHFIEVRIGKTASKRILGVMNDIAFHCQDEIDRATPRSKVSLSDLELRLASIPHATLGYRTASEVTVDLLKSFARSGAV